MIFLKVIALIGVPMILVQLIYRLIDRKGNKTKNFVKKFPVFKKRKFLFQIVCTAAFVVLFGLVCMLFKIPIAVFFVISGAVVGFINGFAVTLMYLED